MTPLFRSLFIVTLGIIVQTSQGVFAKDVVERSFYSGTIRSGYPDKGNYTMKGIVLTPDPNRDAYLCYDTDLMRVSLAWTGEFLKFGNGQREISHPPPAEVAGVAAFGTRPGPGWAPGDLFSDPRPGGMGPLPKSWAKYRGLYLHGNDVVLSYSAGTASILEMPGVIADGTNTIFTRTIRVASGAEPLTLLVAEHPSAADTVASLRPSAGSANGSVVILAKAADREITAGVVGAPEGARWKSIAGRALLELPARTQAVTFCVFVRSVQGSDSNTAELSRVLRAETKLPDLESLIKGGPARWTAPLITQGTLGTEDGPYVVDTISETLTNPWNARTFFGGFDFFADGRAAICTFHGDVWVVSGLDNKLDQLVWKRFATGLFQPLGLKVVEEKIYVVGRDQMTRLHDLNGDGEADFYECFNNDTVVTDNYHEFCLDLNTDRAGNFFYAKGSPWTPDVHAPQQGTMLKVSRDGSTLEVYASGLRAPNGSAIGPNDELTVSDNQGHWMPASKLNLVRRGGFYGMMPAAQREITLQRDGTNFVVNPSDPKMRSALRIPFADQAAPIPTDYDKPICWMPMSMDNSSGGQVWVTSDRWGPLKNNLLFMSYGRGTLFQVLTEEVDGVTQGGMIRFPLKFRTGLMRGRCNPLDGQIYVCGLRGWQTDGAKDGGFYRVRYTGKPVNTALALHARKNGMEIQFSLPLDPAAVVDTASYAVEQWNYFYSGNYGSPDFSVVDPKRKGHDSLEVKSAKLSGEGRTVFLEIPEMKPCDQMRIQLKIKGADGTELRQEIFNTIYKLGTASS